MCGIIGYVGLDDAKKELLKGLQALEYRGYDSAGIAYCQPNGIKTIKTVGKVSCLKDKVAKEAADDATSRIPAGIRLFRIVHTYGNYILSAPLDMGSQIVTERDISIRT